MSSKESSQIKVKLFALQDLSYKEFHTKLIPNVNRDKVLGVRTPALRKLSKELWGTKEAVVFLKDLPHKYYEEDNLHGFLIEKINDYEEIIQALDEFLPYVDNWATCDMMSPKLFKKHLHKLLEQIKQWMASNHTYTIRFGIKMLMSYYLDEHFSTEYLDMVSAVQSEEYYVKMMVAWYFATALAKQYKATLPYIEEKTLKPWIHNKIIQKAVESHRITNEQKEYLKTLKIK